MRIPIVVATLLLAACSRPVQLPVHEFRVPAPEEWRAAPTAPSADGDEWWGYFGDEGLDAAIRKALACNQNLRAAAARVSAAVQERRIVGASALPEVSVGANRLRQRQNFVGLPFPGLSGRVLSSTFTTAGLAFNVNWEIDLWNRLGAEKLAAEATLGARQADLQAARLSLSGQVAKAWFAAVEAQGQVDLSEAIVAHLETVAERTRERYTAGSRSPVDVRAAESDIERARATVREREGARDRFVRQLEVLACEYPSGDALPEAGLPSLPPEVPAGLPSELVRRRPDLVAAERELLAADAGIARAKTALRPSFSLTSTGGTSSNTLMDLVNPGLQVWTYALGVAQPIFNRGRLKAGVRGAEARAEEAAARYEGLTWTAYREVETALASERTLREQRGFLLESRRITDLAIELAERRYGAGLGDVFSVLALRRTALEVDSAVLALERVGVDNRVDLHLALGGGFRAEPAAVRPPDADGGEAAGAASDGD